MSQMTSFLAIEVDNRPITEKPTVWLYGDDGYRFYVRWESGPETNLDKHWLCVMEYKHCDYGETALIGHILRGWFNTEEEALARPVCTTRR